MTDAPDLRAEIAALERRLARLEQAGRREGRCPRCGTLVPEGRFCASCGAPLFAAPAAPVAPVAAPFPAPPRAPVAPAPPSAPPRAMNVETLLGQRWAPRAGAVLVFLGVVFFLGVAIQRGWIGPLAQLAIAAVTGLGLVVGGGVLTARRGYGTYPQVLEGTGAAVLYVTAFVAYALPYYAEETNLTELGGGLLMALIALGTVGLALWRDARVIAGLGYSLAFITAILGVGALPAFTLPYVALLGTSLAFLVAKKGWVPEGVVGSLATGALLLWLGFRGEPSEEIVALVGLAPAAAFLWLAARPVASDGQERPLVALLALGTFAWASIGSLGLAEQTPARGAILLAWALVAVGHAVLAVRLHADRLAILASATAAVVLWIVGAPMLWSELGEGELLTTFTYALGAMAAGAAAVGRPSARGLWGGAVALAGAAAFHAVTIQGLMHPPWEASDVIAGPWQAWATLAIMAGALAPLVAAPHATPLARRAGFWIAAAFGTSWAFALFAAPLLTTSWLVLVVAAVVLVALRVGTEDATVRASALAAALLVLLFAAVKTAIIETHLPPVRLDATSAAVQAVVVGGTLLALHQLAATRALFPARGGDPPAVALVGGSAAVFINWAIAYTTQAWPSILSGAVGVAYLAAGLARRDLVLHRYTGFGVLGFVLLRVFLVDMRDTDLAVRAVVFAVLGGILLGVGYVYTRMSRRDTNSP